MTAGWVMKLITLDVVDQESAELGAALGGAGGAEAALLAGAIESLG